MIAHRLRPILKYMPSYWLKIEVKIEVEIIISNSKNHAITKHDN